MEPGPSSPSPSSACADHPTPAPEEDEEGGRGWVVVPASEVPGADAPKVIDWEDLQQELARVWSLSAALATARERKALLAARLQSALEARKASVQQDNELAEIRERVQARADFMWDLKMHTKKMTEDVDDRREELRIKIRTLSTTSNTLSTARNKLKEADKLLSGENGLHVRLKTVERMLRTRQQYMTAQVAHLYPVRPLIERSPANKPSFLNSSILKTRDAESMAPNGSQNGQAPLAILGLQLSKLTMKKTGYFSDKTEIQNSATALGYVAHAVSLIASYLDVPLRYPLRLGGSRSYVLDRAPSVESSSLASAISSAPLSTTMRTMEFPLFFESQETTRSAYAIFLLNKDIEQLLNHIGAESLGPRHVLANLKQLTTIVQSQQYISN
ncbi:vacuolar protein sorting 38 [Oryza sativa Japonica Group]|uniref:Os06g0715000 protein n=4 Tax=Oryza TaxID=4527 RepID=Q0D9H9_ORYSJ|nr:uncharacterized protein LOC4342067 [Oryza sativa Japonica Group]EEE66356.1 hypothetical protein OsJ_22656 [Oryza sativa Japonica Group]KAF2928491.1 hypothetical protein DAI22_06g282400 [Oryza sativa Japonica Group]BAD53571.1 unknown protein [Oryza sativa Japonica Group]BAF20494.1 Os06g0715000 [Oryza sativa Japonica Group]BAS99491.1 Os06g0715000 [Oryza sativa Japonica Group]|eukprot:NP_001058580.1 Os06g0715000 [Oryza sativa Japonica Group]